MKDENTTEDTASGWTEFTQTSNGETIEVPASPLLRVETHGGLGSVPGLDDEELLDENELSRLVAYDLYGPLLMLPAPRSHGFRPEIDEHGHIIGAFGSVDFARIAPEFDRARYKLDRLRDQLADTLHTLSLVRRRLPLAGLALTLKYLRMGILQPEHITSEDVRAIQRLAARVDALKDEIGRIRQYRRQKRSRELAGALAALPG